LKELEVSVLTMATDDARRAVQTYVPASQRERWLAEADDLDMSQAEYVRSMVQAGRRNLGIDERERTEDPDANPRGNDVKDRVLSALSRENPVAFDRIVAQVTGDIEGEVQAALSRLDQDDRVRHRPGEGYVIDGE
jgi:predicted Rossmann fold nucleotide-binding protein DprA/Smf involved in DNA uptake